MMGMSHVHVHSALLPLLGPINASRRALRAPFNQQSAHIGLCVFLWCAVASGVVQGGMRLKGISGGEKRRLALVACAITSPAIMFLDGKSTPHATTLSHLAHPISPGGQPWSLSLLQSRRVGWTRTRPSASWSTPPTGPLGAASYLPRFINPAARSGSYSTRYGPTLDSNRSTEKTYTELSLSIRA